MASSIKYTGTRKASSQSPPPYCPLTPTSNRSSPPLSAEDSAPQQVIGSLDTYSPTLTVGSFTPPSPGGSASQRSENINQEEDDEVDYEWPPDESPTDTQTLPSPPPYIAPEPTPPAVVATQGGSRDLDDTRPNKRPRTEAETTAKPKTPPTTGVRDQLDLQVRSMEIEPSFLELLGDNGEASDEIPGLLTIAPKRPPLPPTGPSWKGRKPKWHMKSTGVLPSRGTLSRVLPPRGPPPRITSSRVAHSRVPPTPIAPTPVAPSRVAPTPVAPAPVTPTPVAPIPVTATQTADIPPSSSKKYRLMRRLNVPVERTPSPEPIIDHAPSTQPPSGPHGPNPRHLVNHHPVNHHPVNHHPVNHHPSPAQGPSRAKPAYPPTRLGKRNRQNNPPPSPKEAPLPAEATSPRAIENREWIPNDTYRQNMERMPPPPPPRPQAKRRDDARRHPVQQQTYEEVRYHTIETSRWDDYDRDPRVVYDPPSAPIPPPCPCHHHHNHCCHGHMSCLHSMPPPPPPPPTRFPHPEPGPVYHVSLSEWEQYLVIRPDHPRFSQFIQETYIAVSSNSRPLLSRISSESQRPNYSRYSPYSSTSAPTPRLQLANRPYRQHV